jgi:ubiquinone/menaquinone biosynthesis C-methylase UbiE
MTEKQKTSKWKEIKTKIFAWHLDNHLINLLETLLLGDCTSAFLDEFFHIVVGNELVLDIGAGTGRFSLIMARKLINGKVICLDQSQEMLQYLKLKSEKEGLNNRIQILHSDASSSGLENESVNLVICNKVFHELSNPETVLKEIHRVLKPNGKIIVIDFRNTWIGKLICKSHSKDAHGPFTVNELKSLFAKSGLNNIKVYPVKHWVIGVAEK